MPRVEQNVIPGHLRVWLPAVAVGAFSLVWYRWAFDPAGVHAAQRLALFLYGLPPVLVAIGVSISVSRGRFAPVGAAAVAIVLGLPLTLFAHTPDLAFYIGKTLWAARGEPLVDPAMGIVTGYPAVFFVLWGWVAKFLGAAPIVLLRWATVWNLAAFWFVLWFLGRRLVNPDRVSMVLWVSSLALFAKEIGGCLFASPACFSMPLAVAGWWLWIVASRGPATFLGAFLVAAAIVIWPAHLFGALGVGLVMGWRRVRSSRAWVYAGAVVLAGAVVWWLRQAVPAGESFSGLRLVPPDLSEFLRSRILALVTLGTHAHGPIISLAGAATLGLLVYLALRGLRGNIRSRDLRETVHLAVGLGVGALLSAWFMIQPAFGIRVLFLAAVALAPLAAEGVHSLVSSSTFRLFRVRRLWTLAFGFLWLLPFLISAAVSAEWDHRWHARTRAVSEWLADHAQPGQRVWATPGTFRDVVLGKMPVFGFLGHDWPSYYGAPQLAADSIAAAYAALRDLGPDDRPRRALADAGVDWVVLDLTRDTCSLAGVLAEMAMPAYADSCYSVYRVPVTSPDSETDGLP